jgi:hypothetical protein
MFVYCLALRIDGGLWDRLTERYHWEEEPAPSKTGNARRQVATPVTVSVPAFIALKSQWRFQMD